MWSSSKIKCEGFELWSRGSVSILPDAKVQPLEKEKVLLWVLALEQSRMGIMKMRRPVRVSALESDCLGLNLNHQKKKKS